MQPEETGRLYDAIAPWWDSLRDTLTAGLPYVQRAIALAVNRGKALDVGCGSGGRVVKALLNGGFAVTGLDVSRAMINLARTHHPGPEFVRVDVCEWLPQEQYDMVIAWDSIFHVPHADQRRVTHNLCQALALDGVILFTAGGIDGEIAGEMQGHTFYYSSLAEEKYIEILRSAGCTCVLMDHDQYPENHVVFIAVKNRN